MGGIGSEECDRGSRPPSGVDWSDPFVPIQDGVEAGLLREDGMEMAAVIRANEGCGEGIRGRRDLCESPLTSAKAWSEAVVEVEDDMVAVRKMVRCYAGWL